MRHYQFIPHTADVCLRVEADTLEELFHGALAGMNEVLREGFCTGATGTSASVPVEIRSMDTTTLLIDFLSAVLTHTYLERTLYCRLTVKRLTANHIQAVVEGRPVDFFTDDIKAVTYHGAEVRRNANGLWETPIIFDI